MLIEFNVENFRSIRDKVTFSLLASSDKSLDYNLIETDLLKYEKLLKSAVIFGANASGKTNFTIAFGELKTLIMNSHKFQKGTKLIFTPFKLDEKFIKKPTRYEIIFVKNGIRFVYGLSHNSEKIVNEYLYYYPSGRKALIFERENTKNYRFTVDKKEQEFISERTLDNALYLSNSTQLNYKKTSVAFDWFKENLQVVIPSLQPGLEDYTAHLLHENADIKKSVLKALVEADMGINDISTSIKKVEITELPQKLQEKIKFETQQRRGETGGIEQISIRTAHQMINDKGKKEIIFFNFNEESEGTKRMFALIGPWIDSLKNGRVIVADELDTKLHHFLNVFLINLFHDPIQNKNNAQLIFTTHNTNLLDQDLFRRDQIWFTEKNPEIGNTELYSLLEFRPRKDKDIQKGYLAGRYGALPFIKGDKIV